MLNKLIDSFQVIFHPKCALRSFSIVCASDEVSRLSPELTMLLLMYLLSESFFLTEPFGFVISCLHLLLLDSFVIYS